MVDGLIKYILWVDDELLFETARIRKLKKELKDTPYELRLFGRLIDLYNFLESNKDKVVGVILDLILPVSKEDYKILGGRFDELEAGKRLVEVICEESGKTVPMVILTYLSKNTETGLRIWNQLQKGEISSCVKAIIQKSETSMHDFIETIKSSFNIR